MRKMVRAVGVGGGDDSAGERKRSAGEGKRPPSAAQEAEASKLRRMADEWGGGGGGREGAAAGECDCSASVGAGRMGGEWELLFTQGKGSFAFQFCTSLLESVLGCLQQAQAISAGHPGLCLPSHITSESNSKATFPSPLVVNGGGSGLVGRGAMLAEMEQRDGCRPEH